MRPTCVGPASRRTRSRFSHRLRRHVGSDTGQGYDSDAHTREPHPGYCAAILAVVRQRSDLGKRTAEDHPRCSEMAAPLHAAKTRNHHTGTIQVTLFLIRKPLVRRHWYYEDFIRPNASNASALPSYNLKAFSLLMFKSCPLLHDLVPQHARIWTSFMQYKERVPVCGAVLINEWWDKVSRRCPLRTVFTRGL